MADPGPARPPFVVRRAHGVAPGVDGQEADARYKAQHPPPAPPPRQTRRPAQVETVAPEEKQQSASTVPAHELVLADLYQQRDLINAAIKALEAMYHA